MDLPGPREPLFHTLGKMFFEGPKMGPWIWGPGPKFGWQGKVFCGKRDFQMGGMGGPNRGDATNWRGNPFG